MITVIVDNMTLFINYLKSSFQLDSYEGYTVLSVVSYVSFLILTFH